MQLIQQRGFTLVELTIAFGLFSALLLVMTVGVMRLYTIYEAGHEIRDTQEAARSVAQGITADAHNSLAVAIGTSGGQSSICFYQSISQDKAYLNGVEYYVAAHDTGGGTYSGSLAVHRSNVTTNYTPNSAPNCPAPIAGAFDNVVTASSVVVHAFQAVTATPVSPSTIPNLVNVKMSIESAYAQQPGDFTDDTANPGFHTCVAGSNSQYCSITDLQMSALTHPVSDL